MRNLISLAMAVGVFCTPVVTAYAKGSPERIVITCRCLPHEIEITDAATLKLFDPWSGQFADWNSGPIELLPQVGESLQSHGLKSATLSKFSYHVFLFMEWRGRHSVYDRGKLKMIYSFRYEPSAAGARGRVYLPGKKDTLYLINSATILREGHDGNWVQASEVWEKLVKKLSELSH